MHLEHAGMGELDLKTLAAFVQAADIGNITQTAILLGITQPSLSRSIANLESEFGGPLFYRTGRGVTLTELGQAALPRARALVLNSEQLVADMRELGDAPSGLVTLALLPSLMRDLAGLLFDSVRKRYPRIQLRMQEGFSGQIEEWLSEGRADIALLSRYRPKLTQGEELLTESELMLVGTSEKSPPQSTIRFCELANLPLVLPANPNGLRAIVESAARRSHTALKVVVEADSLEAQKAIIKQEHCYAVLSPQTIKDEVAAKIFQARRIIEPEIPRLVVMATTTQRPVSRAAREVARLIRLIVR